MKSLRILCSLVLLGMSSQLARCDKAVDLIRQEREQQFASQMASYLSSDALAKEFNSLKALTDAEAMTSVAFDSHLNDRSAINRETSGLDNVTQISDKTLGVIGTALELNGMGYGNSVYRDQIISKLSADKQWTLLKIVRDKKAYRVAYLLAMDMLKSNSMSADVDRLKLIAAQLEYIANCGKGEHFSALLKEAANSKDQYVSNQARLVQKAITLPDDKASLEQAYSFWCIFHYDMERIQASNKMISLMHQPAKRLFAKTEQSGTNPGIDALGERMFLIGSEVAFQSFDYEMLDHVAELSDKSALPQSEAKLAPHYFQALVRYSHNDFEGASKAFEPVFFSGIPCDLAAQAGALMGGCQSCLGKEETALAIYEATLKNYPKQGYVIKEIKAKQDPIYLRMPELKNVNLESSLKQTFPKQYEAMLARLKNVNESPELAQAKP